ncbi:ABC transporter permease [Micromonospora carbonacea]|jgi:teichoic acid transport system permease protein|uniref:Transport permease protein n=1 Tax=Micromonospora carbonacea TaxID=47853 RepID=A0A1C4ZDT7_9ACTN|nr:MULTISPECIES: ABC transporter permease [Micromonospora]MBB5827640.1 teichoic acid transport system permease protein [Micromonospora carbonacea]MDG4818444.1 ABC transporter permease [Micromonospora sp. WMMD956]QLD24619.1 ABC transporter permease [Micromonospora carbonacea]WFE60983.1 ABC transporter permease [Micromonospora sp. WMMD712]SCF31128.1 teichoic acid transport system permease protein [Micromonospora carbonacea]
MANTALADPDAGLSQAQLAARYGLRVAGERPSLAEYTRRLWAYRHFIAAYSSAKLVASFSNARLGQLWQVLTPLTNAAVYYLIFGLVLKQNSIPNFIAYLTAGLFIFNFTQTAVQNGTQSITGNLGLIRALHFPRACLPLAVMLTQFQQLMASLVVLMGIVLVTGEPLTVEWLLLVPVVLLQALFNAGLTMAVARMGSKVADLKQVMPFLVRTWMYGSGVLYNVALFEENLPGWATRIVEANPMLVYIELARHALLEGAPLLNSSMVQAWSYAVGWAVVMGVGGFIYFWRGEQEYGRG